MMRITREEEHYIGRGRPSLNGRIKAGFDKGRPHHRRRHVRGRRQRPLRSGGRLQHGRADRFAALSAAGHALARNLRAHQYRPAFGAKFARRHAGHHPDGAAARESRAQVEYRSGGNPQDQRSGRQGAVRTSRSTASAAYTTSCFLKNALDTRRRRCSSGKSAKPPAASATARRFAAWAFRAARSWAAPEVMTGSS